MIRFEDLKIGESYRNKKHGTIYTLKKVGLFTEGENEVLAYYEDKEGYPWYRPLGLFMIKFETVVKDEKLISNVANILKNQYQYSEKLAFNIANEYLEIYDKLDLTDEQFAAELSCAYNNGLSVREWNAHIENRAKTIKKL